MNQEPENKITDQQLDDMLRDIQIPSDLKNRLLKIPHLDQQEHSLVNLAYAAPSESPRTRWRLYAVAATLLIIAGIIATQWPIGSAPNTPDIIAKQDNTDDSRTYDRAAPDAETRPLEIEPSKNLQQLAQSSARSHLDPEDVTSMIMALAPEYALELGGSQTNLESEMALVREKFPHSRGADLAEQILQRLN